jgi:dihydrofolate reductase
MKAIVASSLNHVIGAQQTIPWHLPEDLQWFRKMTLGQTLVMGRKTFESLPKLLPGRKTLIISRQNLQVPGAQVLKSFEEVFDLQLEGELWICGGAQIYALALPYCEELYLTLVKKEVEGDTYLPPFAPPFIKAEVLQDTPLFSIIRYTNPNPLKKLSKNT